MTRPYYDFFYETMIGLCVVCSLRGGNAIFREGSFSVHEKYCFDGVNCLCFKPIFWGFGKCNLCHLRNSSPVVGAPGLRGAHPIPIHAELGSRNRHRCPTVPVSRVFEAALLVGHQVFIGPMHAALGFALCDNARARAGGYGPRPLHGLGCFYSVILHALRSLLAA